MRLNFQKPNLIGAVLIPLLLIGVLAPSLQAHESVPPPNVGQEMPEEKDILDNLLEGLLLVYPEDISPNFPYPQCGNLCRCVMLPLSPFLNFLPPILVCIMEVAMPPLEPAINNVLIPCCANNIPVGVRAIAPSLCYPLIESLFPLLEGLIRIVVAASAYPYETGVLVDKVVSLIVQHPEILVHLVDMLASMVTGGPILLCLNPTLWPEHPYWGLIEQWNWANIPGSIYTIANGIVILMSDALSLLPLSAMTGIVDMLPVVIPRGESG
jgi:hypothetical protein